MDGRVYTLAVFDDGSGPALFAGGQFGTAGGTAVSRLARWNGTSWSIVGTATWGEVRALAVYDDGGGPALFAAGNSGGSRVRRWNGSTWTSVGGAFDSSIDVLYGFDEGGGPALYAGGHFTTAAGTPASRLARRVGGSWVPLGAGMDNYVTSMAAFDGGSGPSLYVGGAFFNADGVIVNQIARWTGSTFASVAGGTAGPNPWVQSLHVFNDGSGAALYVGGYFSTIGGVGASGIARWKGAAWSAVGGGVAHSTFVPFVNAMTTLTNISGSSLLMGGLFESAGGQTVGNVAAWRRSGLPFFAADPQNLLVDAGDPAAFATVAIVGTGGAIPTYQWRRNGAALANGGGISGADTDSLTIASADVADFGVYELFVTNSCGSALSRPAALGVIPANTCPADTNGNLVVDVPDLLRLLADWGPCP
jgi:hypothetical protein